VGPDATLLLFEQPFQQGERHAFTGPQEIKLKRRNLREIQSLEIQCSGDAPPR
jgi:hypothetical protein